MLREIPNHILPAGTERCVKKYILDFLIHIVLRRI